MNLVAVFDKEMGLKSKKHPTLRPGYTVRVHQCVKEGGKDRIQIFEGLIIAIHKASQPNHTFTVRRIASGVGVEKVFALYSPLIKKIEVKKKAKVRRSKLYYLRNLIGRAARLQETHATIATEEDSEKLAVPETKAEIESTPEEPVAEAPQEAAEKDSGTSNAADIKDQEALPKNPETDKQN